MPPHIKRIALRNFINLSAKCVVWRKEESCSFVFLLLKYQNKFVCSLHSCIKRKALRNFMQWSVKEKICLSPIPIGRVIFS